MRLWSRRAICALPLLAGCSTPIQQGPKIRIAVGGQTQLVYLPTTLAAQLGHYAEQGIDVELTDFPGGAKALEALMGGSADVVSGYFDHTIQLAAEGKRLKSFVTMLRYPGLALVSGGGAKSVADLRGRAVGVSAPGSSTHLFLNHLLMRSGLGPEDVSAVGIGMAAGAVAAMERGKVDAAVMAEPAISQLAARKGPLLVLAQVQNEEGVRAVYGTATYPAAVLYARAEWVAANPILAQRLARAVRSTLGWIQAHSSAEIAARMPEAFRGGDDAAYARAVESGRAMYSPDGEMPEEGARAVARVMAESLVKVREAGVNPADCYTNEFLR
jgi:NitT/TauT family transport system substrate-binding protein